MSTVSTNPSDIPRDYQITTALSATSVTVPNLTNHRRTLTDLFVKDGASGYNDIKLGSKTVMRIYDNLAQAAIVKGPELKPNGGGFFTWMRKLFPQIPLFTATQDESVIVARDSTADAYVLHWIDQEGGNVNDKTVDGGSQAKKQFFIMNMSNPSTISASATNIKLTQQDMPDGLTIFIDTQRMAANTKFTLLALAGNFPKNTNSSTQRVHIFDEFTEMFTSETNQGILVDQLVANELAADVFTQNLFVLPTPYVFNPNRQLTFAIDATIAGGNNLNAGTQQLFLIGIREYV